MLWGGDMGKMIKTVVNTGWASGDHVDYHELPINWDDFTEDEKQKHLDELATDELHETCEAYAKVVDEED